MYSSASDAPISRIRVFRPSREWVDRRIVWIVNSRAVKLYSTFDFQNCKLLEKMDLEECLLITDATLTHLAMGCPRLEKLVSSDLMLSVSVLGEVHDVWCRWAFLKSQHASLSRVLPFPSAEPVTLWVDHRRRPPTNCAVAVCGGTSSRLRAGQLPEHLGQWSEPSDAGLSQSRAYWTLRLPTHYQRGHT